MAGARVARETDAVMPAPRRHRVGADRAVGHLPGASSRATPALKLFETPPDRRQRRVVVFFLFDNQPFRGADIVDRGKDRPEIHRAAAKFSFVFQVNELHAGTVVAKKFFGRVTASLNPIHVDFGGEIARLGRAEQPLEYGPAFEQFEFPGVIVITELESGPADARADLIQVAGDFFDGRGRHEFIRRPPWHDDVTGPEEQRISDDPVRIAAQCGDADVHAGDFEPRRVERRFCSGRIQISVAGEFHPSVTDARDFRDRGGKIALQIIAHGPELKGNGNCFHEMGS